jgi:outer membrane receptor for ferrienterochelin and colicin
MKLKFIVGVLLFFVLSPGLSQDILNHRLEENEIGKPLSEYLHQIEKGSNNKFFFIDKWLDGLSFEKSYEGMRLEDALKKILQGTDVTFASFYGYAVVFAKDPNRTLEKMRFIQSIKSDKRTVETKSVGKKENSKPGDLIELKGVVKDGKTLDPLAGAIVQVKDVKSVITQPDGTFIIQIPVGEHYIVFQYSNYEEKIIHLDAYESGDVSVELMETPKVLDEVVVTGRQSSAVTSNVGQIDIKMAQLKKLPTFLGEVDILKQIQVLPGVTSVGEMSSGYNVRGGGVDQNLILYDGVQIFNNSHVFGFFSAFNSEAIKSASFYKGGIPAEYGGRVSSVMNIISKEGDYKKWSASGGIGPVSATLAINGPVQKDKSSFFASVRSSYSDWLVKKLSYSTINKSSVSFYDASLKFSHKFNERDKLTLSGYASQDHFGLPTDTTFKWGNLVSSLQFDHSFNSKAFSTITFGYGKYAYDVTDNTPTSAYNLKYSISYPTFKADFNYQLGAHKLNTGIGSILYGISPGTIVATSPESNVKPQTTPHTQSLENSFFVSDEFEVNDNFRIDAGVRLSSFSSFGPQNVYVYQPGQPLSNTTIVDTISYPSGKTVKNYFGFEPRLALVYKVSPFSSIKVGYNRIFQYIHLISNSVSITPIDIWQASNYYFKPQIGDQFSGGYFRSSRNAMYEFSVEGFYKFINNILDFKDGSTIILNPNLETALLRGVAKSYGVEFSAKKNLGRLQGSLNYTYARSLRKVQSEFTQESINNGNYYPSNYDQPNVVNLTWRYELSRRFSFTGNFTYRTGRPITLPYSYGVVNNIPIVNYSDRNQERIPDYHRLDLALVIDGNHKRKKIVDGSWIISIYNVYARKNVYSVFYKTSDTGIQVPYQLSIVGTVLPSISYRFKI